MRSGVELQIVSRAIGAWMIVSITGEVDLSCSPALAERCTELVDAGHRNLIIDCTEVQFLGSSGLAVLLDVRSRIEELGGRLRVAGLRTSVARVFQVTELDKVFDIYASVESALSVD
jgi:anti-sigma B factor antagonist